MNTLRDLSWWHQFWNRNDLCLYGDACSRRRLDNILPRAVRKNHTCRRVPVLIELGEDWIIDTTGAEYRRYIRDFEYQQRVRGICAVKLEEQIGFHLKPKVDTSSLLHGSIYGNPVIYPKDSTPWLKPVISSPEEILPLIRRMEKTDLRSSGLLPDFVRHYQQLNQPYRWRILHDPTSVHGPGTILGFLCGINNAAIFLYDIPDLMQELLELITKITVEYTREVRKLTGAPSSGIGIFDDVAGLVSPEHFRNFFLPVYRKLFEELSPEPNDERFIHNDAAVTHLLPFFSELEVNGINPDPLTDLMEIRKYLPDAYLYAGIPPLLLAGGTTEEVYKTAMKSLHIMKNDPKFILTTAGSLNMGTPLINIQALCEAADDFANLLSEEEKI